MTRKEFMEAITLDTEENRKLHREYHSQYVTEGIRETVRSSNITLDHKVKDLGQIRIIKQAYL